MAKKAIATKKAQRVAKAKPKTVIKGSDKVKYMGKAYAEALEAVPMITAEEAVAMGWTGAGLRAMSNSLERIARDKTNGAAELEYQRNERSSKPVKTTVNDLSNYNARINFGNARKFRTLAKMVDMLNG